MDEKKVKYDFKSHFKVQYTELNNNGGSKHLKCWKNPQKSDLGHKIRGFGS